MTIHVTIGEAKTRLSELAAAVRRGEEVVVSEAGEAPVRLVPVMDDVEAELERRRALRKSAFGMWKEELRGIDTTVPPSMTDEELEERWRRKFGPAA